MSTNEPPALVEGDSTRLDWLVQSDKYGAQQILLEKVVPHFIERKQEAGGTGKVKLF